METIEVLKQKLVRYHKLIANFKAYDEKRKKYVHILEETLNEFDEQKKELEKAKKKIVNLTNEIERLKKNLEMVHDDFDEFLDAYESAPGTILNPKQKATYYELTQRVVQLKKDNKELRSQMEKIISQHTKEIDVLSKENQKEIYKYILDCPDEALNAELVVLRQKLKEKSVAIKDLRKWRKAAIRFLENKNLKKEFDNQQSQEYETD